MRMISFVFLGLFAGFIGSKIVDNRGLGMLMDSVLGIVGAVVGGYVFRSIGAAGVTGFNLWSLGVATVGAIITLSVGHLVRRIL